MIAIKPTEHPTMMDLAWAAGFIEGEGWFGTNNASASIVVSQTSIEPLKRLQRLFGGSVISYKIGGLKRVVFQRKPIWKWTLGGAQAAGLMMTLYSLMSSRRENIDRALAKWRSHRTANAFLTHCKRGHEFTSENTFRRAPTPRCPWWARICIKCQRARGRMVRAA